MAEHDHNKRSTKDHLMDTMIRDMMTLQNSEMDSDRPKWQPSDPDHVEQFRNHLKNTTFGQPLDIYPESSFMDDTLYEGGQALEAAKGFGAGLYNQATNGMDQAAGTWDEQMKQIPQFTNYLQESGMVNEDEAAIMRNLARSQNRRSMPLPIPGRQPSGDLPGVDETSRQPFSFMYE